MMDCQKRSLKEEERIISTRTMPYCSCEDAVWTIYGLRITKSGHPAVPSLTIMTKPHSKDCPLKFG